MPSMPAPRFHAPRRAAAGPAPWHGRCAPAARRSCGSRPGRATRPAAAPRRRPCPRARYRAAVPALPLVSVPVLSSISTLARASASSTPPPFTRMPCFAARDTPAMSATGTARISGQGVAMTRTARSRLSLPVASHAAPAMTSVRTRKPRRSGPPAGSSAPWRAPPPPPGGGCWRRCFPPPALWHEVERRAGIGRAAHHGVAGPPLDGKRLAGQCRFVEHGDAALQHAVDGGESPCRISSRSPGRIASMPTSSRPQSA